VSAGSEAVIPLEGTTHHRTRFARGAYRRRARLQRMWIGACTLPHAYAAGRALREDLHSGIKASGMPIAPSEQDRFGLHHAS